MNDFIFLLLAGKIPVFIELMLFLLLLIITSIIRIKVKERRDKSGIPAYHIKPIYNDILKQPILITDNNYNFGMIVSVQDQILRQKYVPGKQVQVNLQGRSLTLNVSRVKKEWKGPYAGGGIHIYNIYFQQYENSEFPVEFTIKKHKKCNKIMLRENSLALYLDEECILSLPWADCFFRKNNYCLEILQSRDSNITFTFKVKNFIAGQHDLLVELLVKYANN